MVRLFDEGTKVLGTLAERRNGSGPYSMASEAGEATKALGEVARQWVSEPGKLAAAQSELFKDYAELWGRSVRRFLGEEDVKPVIEPAPGDNRFKDPDWSNTQFFDFWKQAYLLTARWAEDVTRKTEGVDDKTRKRALFYLEQMLAALLAVELRLHQPRSGARHARHQRGESGAGHGASCPRPRALEGSVAHQPDRSRRHSRSAGIWR